MKIAKKVFFTFVLLLANASTPSPPQASAGRMTLSTSFATTQPLFLNSDLSVEYWGALANPASTHGKNVYPNCSEILKQKI